ncbi:LysR substrate-binding domain-containing protein (plasmid) [Mesorhizobium mediterraneum]|uniref:LysR family transcriptional regulator n=1 Tax=Mesorhizobium mediterraneum TaxID=43617 RepID=A0AB36R2K1_9HYPH|nr:LysR substrate-binding domain-containing protein [Mesorhizobium mediterraneum]PAP98607.1 LysR family transcriptional regulator [Mesorhizobium mediterraneum]WIW57051.1 LysR substrate-binding domain-containing protein [Mesorhizobium mediterraneum]
MKPPPPLNYIRSFECAARHLSFTEAANELGYTQAAISNHVRALEQYLGRQLFLRYPRSLELTEIGEAFLPTLRQGLSQIDFATESVLAAVRNKTVVISCPTSLAENWLARCIASFSKQNPEIEVLLHGTIWEERAEQVADFIITIRRYDNRPEGALQLWKDRLVLLCAPHFLEGPDGFKVPQHVLEANWISVHGRQEQWQRMAAALRIDAAANDKRLSTNSTNIALELAANGAGCVVTTLSLARTYMERGLLVEPFETQVASPWNYYLSEGQTSKGAVVKRVREWILSEAQTFMPAVLPTSQIDPIVDF